MTLPPSQLRAAIVGCGAIGQVHAQTLSRSPLVDLVALCDVDPHRARSFARHLSSATQVTAWTNVDEMLQKESLDLVTVATPEAHHLIPVLSALRAGCHVFCEKPLALSIKDAQQMVDQANTSHRQLAVNYNRRFGFAIQQAQKLISAGQIGTLTQALIQISDHSPPPHVALRPDIMLHTLLTHHIDLLRCFLGDITSVAASFSSPRNDLIREMTISTRHESGALGTIVSAYRDGQSRTTESMLLSGTTGEILAEDVIRRLILRHRDVDETQTFAPNLFDSQAGFYDTIGLHLQAFIAALITGETPPVTGEDGLRGLQIVQAILESHQLQKRVFLENPL